MIISVFRCGALRVSCLVYDVCVVTVVQKQIQDRRKFCQEVIVFHRDTLRPAGLTAAKRRMQRNNGVKAWHGAHSYPAFCARHSSRTSVC